MASSISATSMNAPRTYFCGLTGENLLIGIVVYVVWIAHQIFRGPVYFHSCDHVPLSEQPICLLYAAQDQKIEGVCVITIALSIVLLINHCWKFGKAGPAALGQRSDTEAAQVE